MTAKDKLNVAMTEFGDSEYLRGHEEGIAVALKVIDHVKSLREPKLLEHVVAELREIVKRDEQRVSRRYGK